MLSRGYQLISQNKFIHRPTRISNNLFMEKFLRFLFSTAIIVGIILGSSFIAELAMRGTFEQKIALLFVTVLVTMSVLHFQN
ncbi:MAG: hypothetical protein AAGJ08_14785 [Cyanobacteria bacterium P01_H01_bin.35]